MKKTSNKVLPFSLKTKKPLKDLSHEEALQELEYLRAENDCLKKYQTLLRQKGLLKEKQ